MRLILDMWSLKAVFYMNFAPTLLDSMLVYHFCDTSLVKCYFYHNFDHLLIYDIEPKLGLLVPTVPHVQRQIYTMALTYCGLKCIAFNDDLTCKQIQK